MTTINPSTTYSVETLNASRLLSAKNIDINTAMMAIALASYKASEAGTMVNLQEMNNQNKIADIANKAKALEEKLKAELAKADSKNKDKNIKEDPKAWTDTAKALATELAGLYGVLGINSEAAAKLATGAFGGKDIEGWGAMTKTVADKTLSANQMLNLELSKQNNFMSMQINVATKSMDTYKQNLDRILR